MTLPSYDYLVPPEPGRQIDWGNSLADRLAFVYIPHFLRTSESVGGHIVNIFGASADLKMDNGLGRVVADCNHTTNSGFWWDFPEALYAATDQYTIALHCRIDDMTSSGNLICIPYGSGWASPYQTLALERWGTTSKLLSNFTDSSDTRRITATTGEILDIGGGWHWLVMSRNGTTTDFYLDGAFYETGSTNANTVNWFGHANPLHLFQRNKDSYGSGTNGATDFIALWGRPLRAEEVADLDWRRYELFRRPGVLELIPPMPSDATIAMVAGDVTGALSATAGSTASLAMVADAVTGALSATAGSTASLAMVAGDVTGALSATVSTDATLTMVAEDVVGAFAAFQGTTAALTMVADDVTGSISATHVGPPPSTATLAMQADDVTGNIDADFRIIKLGVWLITRGMGWGHLVTAGMGEVVLNTNATIDMTADDVTGAITVETTSFAILGMIADDVAGSISANVGTSASLAMQAADVTGSISANVRTSASLSMIADDVTGALSATFGHPATLTMIADDVVGQIVAKVSVESSLAMQAADVVGAISATAGSTASLTMVADDVTGSLDAKVTARASLGMVADDVTGSLNMLVKSTASVTMQVDDVTGVFAVTFTHPPTLVWPMELEGELVDTDSLFSLGPQQAEAVEQDSIFSLGPKQAEKVDP